METILPGFHQIASEHHPGVRDGHHLIALAMCPANGSQLHHAAAQVEVVRGVVDDVRGSQFDALQLPGDRFAETLDISR